MILYTTEIMELLGSSSLKKKIEDLGYKMKRPNYILSEQFENPTGNCEKMLDLYP